MQLKQFQVTNGPFLFSESHNLFSFSLPFVKEIAWHAFYVLLQRCANEPVEEFSPIVDESTAYEEEEKEISP